MIADNNRKSDEILRWKKAKKSRPAHIQKSWKKNAKISNRMKMWCKLVESIFFSTTHTWHLSCGYALFPHSAQITEITSLNARLMSKQKSEKSDESVKFHVKNSSSVSNSVSLLMFPRPQFRNSSRSSAVFLINRARCLLCLISPMRAWRYPSLKISERWRVKSIISWINFSSIVCRHLSAMVKGQLGVGMKSFDY